MFALLLLLVVPSVILGMLWLLDGLEHSLDSTKSGRGT